MSAGLSAGAATPLTLANLSALPATVARPAYARDALEPGIVHFGPGNFHRAHMGVYLDALMNAGTDHDWGVIGASVMPADSVLRATLLGQDLLTTVVAQSSQQSRARVTGPMLDYLPVADSAAILAALVDPQIRIVSLTVTEGGYFLAADTGAFDVSHPSIQADAANFETPQTVFGLIARALMLRRDAGTQAFTVMSCDNIPHNGHVTRAAVVGFARLVDAGLADWIEAHSSFPNAMVDRIAPATGDRERELLRQTHAIEDGAPVFCEEYLQWVLEDDFVAGRPAFETVGVEFVTDVTPFEMMKIRILNGGHAVIAYPAALLDIEFAHDAMAHPLVSGLLDKVAREEILPAVPPVPNTDISAYLESIKTRFANPNIGDTTRRLCFDGSNRQPKFIIPTARDRVDASASVVGLALVSALWCRYCAGTTDSGNVIEPNDPSWAKRNAVAQQARQTPAAWLAMTDVYGALGDNETFSAAFASALNALWRDGTQATLQAYLRA